MTIITDLSPTKENIERLLAVIEHKNSVIRELKDIEEQLFKYMDNERELHKKIKRRDNQINHLKRKLHVYENKDNLSEQYRHLIYAVIDGGMK